jgi:hypothetical protein
MISAGYNKMPMNRAAHPLSYAGPLDISRRSLLEVICGILGSLFFLGIGGMLGLGGVCGFVEACDIGQFELCFFALVLFAIALVFIAAGVVVLAEMIRCLRRSPPRGSIWERGFALLTRSWLGASRKPLIRRTSRPSNI